jgi:hypothetical protein
MFLIDSSAWIEYLRPGGSRKVKERVKEILHKEEACCCGVVTVEILRGARTEREFNALKESFLALPQLPLDGPAVELASKWGFLLDRKGKTVSATDLLIAAAAHKKACVLHLDSDFGKVASVAAVEQERL